MINIRVRLTHFEKILITETEVLRSSNWGNFLTDFLGEIRQLVNISKANFYYILIDLSIFKFPFLKKKMKLFLVKGFYLNFAKTVKCILRAYLGVLTFLKRRVTHCKRCLEFVFVKRGIQPKNIFLMFQTN